MVNSLKAKDIGDSLYESIIPSLESVGFKTYKPKQLIKLNYNVLQYFKLFPNKNDIYLWCAAYPLIQNDIWLGSGVVAERFPEVEGELKVSDSASLKKGVEYVVNRLPDVINFFEDRSTLEGIEKLIPSNAKVFPLLVKGFCLSSLRKDDEARVFLTKFIDSGIDLGESRSGAEKLLASISEGNSKELLEENRINNIKKLRLKKFL
jgi:hypothetical protein